MRDYASEQRKQKTKKKRWLLWIFILLFISIALTLLLKQTRHHPKTLHVIKHSAKPTKALNPTTTTTAKKAPQYDFYSILSKTKVAIHNIQPQTNSLANSSHYYLQATYSRSLLGVQDLVSKLGAEGYPAQIKNTKKQSVTYYSVVIGPYANRDKAVLDQQQLHKENTDTLLISPIQ